MLVGEPNRLYEVYPSWADFSYRWEELPELLANPLASRYFHGKQKSLEYYLELDYPREIKPCRLISGPEGGGIISVDLSFETLPPEKWLPGLILVREANCWTPSTLQRLPWKVPFHVAYLEPRDDPFHDYLNGKKRKKTYFCDPHFTHIDSDPEGIYWAIGFKKARQAVEALQHLPDWARAFAVELIMLPSMPEVLREETSSLFADPQVDFAWFRVEGGSNGAGYHYAVVLYLAMHLRFAVGARMRSMRMLAGIEGGKK